MVEPPWLLTPPVTALPASFAFSIRYRSFCGIVQDSGRDGNSRIAGRSDAAADELTVRKSAHAVRNNRQHTRVAAEFAVGQIGDGKGVFLIAALADMVRVADFQSAGLKHRAA